MEAPRDRELMVEMPVGHQEAATLASPLRRLSAWLVDVIVSVAVFAAVVTAFILMYLVIDTAWSTEEESHVEGWVFVGIVFVAVVFGVIAAILFQFVMVLMVAKHGQTLGKKLLKIRIIKIGGGELGFRRALVRELLGKWVVWVVSSVLLDSLFGLVRALIPFASELFAFFDAYFVLALVTLHLALFIWLLLDSHHRTLHDKIAGTYVVRV